jgi:hypothetical protein
MLKGVLLALSLSVFIVSLIFVISSSIGSLQENLITGNVIGKGSFTSYAIISLVFSFVFSLAVSLWMKNSFRR